jgi:uncharacterized membrane protein
MNNSIEQIWKHGFVESNLTAIPKINNLYSKKSKNIVDKIHRMYALNVKYLFVLPIFISLICFAKGWLILATTMPFLLLWIAFIARKQLKKLDLNSKSDNSYQYIKGFNQWFNAMVSSFTWAYQVFYPSLALTILVEIRISTVGKSLIEEYLVSYPDSGLLFGAPWVFYFAACLIIAVVGYFATTLYMFDLKLMYGRVMKKLDEILCDMEELRQ